MTAHLLLLLFIPVLEAWSSVLRVETGHQPIAIEGRDMYMGYFTKVLFDSPTCIGGLIVHCLRPLTGAEEIDLLYTACPKGHWKVAHYMNTKEEFHLKTEVTAKQLLIASREPLTIIDVQVISCTSLSSANVSCHEVREHPHRHSHSPDTLRAHDIPRIRRKRAVTSSTGLDFEPGSQAVFEEDKIVPRGSTMTVERGAVLRFAPGTSLIVNGALLVKGTKSAPVRFEAMESSWNGINIVSGSPASSLRYLNISGVQGAGLTIMGGTPPTLENVISDSNGIGFRIESNASEIRVVKLLALNNRGAGFVFSGKANLVLDSCTAAANRGNGFHIMRSNKVKIIQASSYSNNRLGIFTEDVNNLKAEDTVLSGNGAGYRFTKQVKGKSIITLVRQNISGHHYGPAILLEDDIDTDFTISNCLIYDNYQGGFKSSGHYEGSMQVVHSNFTRNRGPTLTIDTLHRGTVRIEHCAFHQNQLNDYASSEAVMQIVTDNINDHEANATISDCEFTKNIINDVILFKKQAGNDPNITLENNDIRGNLARNVISFNTRGVLVKHNFLNNAQSSCEIMVPHLSFFNPGLNYWSYAIQAEIRERICTPSATEVVTARNVDDSYKTNPNIVRNPLPQFESTYNLIRSLPTPYTVDADLIVTPNQTIVVEPGTQFLFGPNVGITVQERGKLILNGSEGPPIVMSSTGVGAWRGITIKPGGSIMAHHVTLNDPSIGLWLDSDRFSLEIVIVNKPNVHGVEVTTNTGPFVDLGGTLILDSIGTALAVDERNQDITLRDFQIENAGISGIDFVSPSNNITIEDARIVNSGSHGIHISEYSQSPLNSVAIRNVTLKDQRTGHAGLLISGGWISDINLERIHAEGNAVPSIMLALECNNKPSMTTISDSTFIDNRDTVVSLQLGECGGLQLNRNLFDRNNADGRAGVVRVDIEPNPGLDDLPVEIANNDFSANGGDFVVFLSSDGDFKIDGSMNRNRLNNNAVSQAAVIVASPSFNIEGNRFENPKTQYQLEPRGDGSWILNATRNWWGTEDLSQIIKTVKAPEGSVRIQPYLMPGEALQIVDPPPTNSIVAPPGGFEQCAHINYCFNRGQCIGGLCICPEGYGGADCSVLTGCSNNCSRNGECNVFKVCHCFEGWTGSDCSTPMCSFDCGGHGKCVSKDECECEELWAGEFCMEPACTEETCINGKCQDKQCQCDGPWRGRRCDVPVCTECSLNGLCTAPETCECFADWGGSDCSTCVGPSCSSCDMDCDHGNCDEVTRTCTCAKGWSGAACDLCEATCSTTGRIITILPQTADKENINTVVTVFGNDLPKTPNGHYSCVYGTFTTVGMRQSSRIIRCPIPANLTAGRYLFSLAAGPNVLTNTDGKPIHFTVYDACHPTVCQGSCVGPLCVCSKGRTGVFCEVIEPIPEIDRHFLNNQQVNTAVEGTPYVVYLPTMPGTVLRLNSTIPDLRLDPVKGLLEWSDPVGQSSPHEITVVADSLSGESTISWNVSVQPSYTATVEDVSTEGNKLIFKGSANGQQIKHMPITIKVRSGDGSRMEELTTMTDNEGNFTYAYIPAESGEYLVSASHPGEDSNNQQEFKVVAQQPPSITEENDLFVIHVPGEKNCSASSLSAQAGEVSSEFVVNELQVQVKPMSMDEFYVLVDCDIGKELIRIPQRGSHDELTMVTYPGELHLFQDPVAKLSNPVEIRAYPRQKLVYPIEVVHADRPVNIINTFPNSQDYDAINRDGISIVLQMDVTQEGKGNISIVSNKEELARIPYTIAAAPFLNSRYLLLSVCIRDEFYGQGPPDNKIVASLSFTNLQLSVDQTQNNVVVNGEAAVFNLHEGYYQVTVSSPIHNTLSKFVQVSEHNTSFCLYLTSSPPITPSLSGNNWTQTLIAKPNGRLPYLQFDPPVIVEGAATDVLVTVKGDVPGVLSVENSDFFQSKVQSTQLNDSFWATVMVMPVQDDRPHCTARLLPIKFDFLADDSNFVAKSASSLVAHKPDIDNEQQMLCDENGNTVPVGSVTKILCNCGEGAKARCRQQYTSATACGASWARIPDDTVSLQVLSTFLLLISDCQEVQLNFDDLDHVLNCVSALEKECPNVETRKKKQIEGDEYPTPPTLVVEEAMQNDGPASIINRISSLQGSISPVMQPMINVFNAIDMQSYRVAGLYQDFFAMLKKVLPAKIPGREDMQSFVRAIGEGSEMGVKISEEEMHQIDAQELVDLWNDTATVWTSGKMDPHKGIQFEDAKLLVAAADKLKSFARQNGATDPFAVLHEYLGKLLQTPSIPNQECAEATVLIEPQPIYDGDTIKIRVFLTNTKDRPLISPTLEFDVLRGDRLAPEATVVASGIGVNPNAATGVLSPGESLETIWLKRIIPQRTLTSTAKYQPAITVSFSVGGRLTKQRLSVPMIDIHPVRSAKIVHFIYPSVGANSPFSIATSIMNTGYSTLENVKVHNYEMIVTDGHGEHLPYKLGSVILDKKRIENALSFDIGIIPSGGSKMISMNVSTERAEANITSVKCPISVNGQMINVQEMSTYVVEAAAGKNGLMVRDATGAHFFFRPDTGNLVNIRPLIYVASRSTELTDPDRKVIMASFKNDESRSFTGYLWGTMDYPDNIPEGYQLVKVTEKANGKRDRQVRPITWKEMTPTGEKLNFIDNGYLDMPYSMTYEFVFADPKQYSVPLFDQSSYRIQLLPDMWWPSPPAVAGQITADSEDGAQVVYSLYSPDGSRRFSVDDLTGSIIVEEPVEPGQEYCMMLVAKDTRGQESRVPIAVNTGGMRKDCYPFNIEGLSPSVSHWSVLPTAFPTDSGAITVSTLPTGQPPTEPPTTTPDEIDIPTPPEIEPSTEPPEVTHTLPTDSHVSDSWTTDSMTEKPVTDTTEPITDSWTTEDSGHTIIIVPTPPWSWTTTQEIPSPPTDEPSSTELVTPDHSPSTLTTEDVTERTTPEITTRAGTSTSDYVTTVESTETTEIYTVTPDISPGTVTTGEPDTTLEETTETPSEETTVTMETVWTESTANEPPTTEPPTAPIHSITPDYTPATDLPTGATITPLPMTTPEWTVEPPISGGTHQTIGGSTDRATTHPTEPGPTDEYTEACRKTAVPVWNLICELSKTVARRGG